MESFTIDNIGDIGRRARKEARPKLGLLAKRTLERYKKAYRRVYGVPPEVRFDGVWYRVKGQSAGVKRMRLKEMAEQLEYRAGDD